jgi:hypothetical protein
MEENWPCSSKLAWPDPAHQSPRKPGATFSMKQQSIEGDYAYILWTAETADNVYEMATDTFVVRDGKIVAQSFTGKITSKG